MKRKALGKGLRSLIPETPPPVAIQAGKAAGGPQRDGLLQIDIDRIRPNRDQPRRMFDAESLQELANSLQTQGLLQPVVVRPAVDGEYELIAGERRWRAAQLAGLMKVTAIVRSTEPDQMLELALIENLQREELNPMEEADAYQALIDQYGLTQKDAAERVGKSRATVANALRLLNLPPVVQDRIRRGEVAAGHAKALAALANPGAQADLAERIAREGLSVRQVEALVKRATRRTAASLRRQPATRDPNLVAAEEKLQSALGTKARIVEGRKGGRIEIQYFSDEELDRLYRLIVAAAKPS